jgi:hypothetical protein
VSGPPAEATPTSAPTAAAEHNAGSEQPVPRPATEATAPSTPTPAGTTPAQTMADGTTPDETTADGITPVGITPAEPMAAEAVPAETTPVGTATDEAIAAPARNTVPAPAPPADPDAPVPGAPAEPERPTSASPAPTSDSAEQSTNFDPWFTAKPNQPGPDDESGTGTPTSDSSSAEASPDTVLPVPDGPAAGAATALRAPTMLTPVVQPDSTTDDGPAARAADPPAADPEQVLATYRWRFHHETLRELVEDPDELRTIRDRLTEKLDPATDHRTRARLLSLRAVVSRILGDLGKAFADGKLALSHAEATGELRRIAIAQARLAHVLQWRGDFAEADRLFEEANSSELPDRLRATMHEHAGRSCYDQGRYIEACNHFERALELRRVEDPDLIARTELALDAVFSKVAQNGWGPYPRSRDEVLQTHRPPLPTFSEKVQRWGYAEPDGQLAIAPSYADVQPFRDGVAWVRRPEAGTWELIDESGDLVIDESAGYLHVGSFSDGLAWVSRGGTGNWIAIDRANKVVIPVGFDDVRPFRRGTAAVRRGHWGAIDRTGRVILPMRYTGFATALTDGRYVDGFTDEGLAIVDSDGRKGVVDRTGRVVVPPAHPTLVIHPVAFLIGSGAGHWGALDRHGEPLIDLVHPSRVDVLDEIDRLLADTKPVL